MNKFAGWLRRLTKSIPTTQVHVTNEQILLLLDGEATDSERRRIQRHLTDCWNCRFRCEEMQGAIHNMVECRNLVVDYRLQFGPPPSRALLAARLREQRESFAAPSHPVMMWLANRRQAVFAAGACAALLPAAVLLFHAKPRPLIASRPVGAQETLYRAIAAEKAETVPSGHVRHRSMLLRVRNVTKAIEMTPRRVEVWDDAARQRSAVIDGQGEVASVEPHTRKTGSPAALRDVSSGDARVADKALSRALPAGFQSLRAVEFSKLVADPSRLSIVRDATKETLTYKPLLAASARTSQPLVLLASLDLRGVDLHPVAEQVAVADDGATWEFRLSEESNVAVPVADVPPGVFGGSVNLALAIASARPPAVAESLDEIVDVLTVLDGAGALTQQDVQLQKTANGRLQVSGVVQDDVRRQALLQLLQSDAGRGLEVRIATVAEQAKRPRKTTSFLAVEGGADNTGADTALTGYLTDTLHLSAAEAERRRVELENQLLAWSNDAESQAEALYEVLSLAPPARTAAASSQARREWESLTQHHASALQRDLSDIENTLRPLNVGLNLSTCAAQPSMSLADPAALLSSTRLIGSSVSSFVASPEDGSPSGRLDSSLGCLLESTEQRASRLITPPPEP